MRASLLHSTLNIQHSTFLVPHETMKEDTLTKIPDLKDRLTQVRSYL